MEDALRDRTQMAAVGHEDAFPPPTLSARCWFSQETFVGTRGNEEDAPIRVIPEAAIEPPGDDA